MSFCVLLPLLLPPPQAAYFCCKEHQVRHWKQHKQVCKHLQQLAAKQEAAAAGGT
jgi:hypothetical protein